MPGFLVKTAPMCGVVDGLACAGWLVDPHAPALCRVPDRSQEIKPRVGRRAMHIVERFHQLGPVRFRERCRRQPVAQTLLSYRIERLRG